MSVEHMKHFVFYRSLSPSLARHTMTSIFHRVKREVNKQSIGEEGRINIIEKMDSLYALRDRFFRYRYQKFHWDIRTCVELRNCPDERIYLNSGLLTRVHDKNATQNPIPFYLPPLHPTSS